MCEKNMKKKILLDKIEQIIFAIYAPDQVNLDEKFIEFLDAMGNYLNTDSEIAKLGNVNDLLMKVQNAYSVKDYVTLADLLLYDIKEKLEVTK